MNRTLLQSGKDDWETPQALYDVLDAEFKFTVDVCANPQNAKCRRFFPERTQSGFTNTYSEKRRFAFYQAGSHLSAQRVPPRFQVWLWFGVREDKCE